MGARLFSGIDLGTTRVKAGVFDAQGNQHDLAVVELGATETWWPTTLHAIRQCLAGIDASRVAGICVGGQGPTLVAVDQAGNPVRPALAYDDQQAATEAAHISTRLRRPVSVRSSYLPRALWMHNHEPDQYARTRWFLQAWDHAVLRLTGQAVATSPMGDYTPWHEADTVSLGLDPKRFPPLAKTAEVIGTLSAQACGETGLPSDTLVVAGGNDFLLGTMGASAARKGIAQSQGGATSAFTLCWDSPLAGEMIGWCIPSPVEPTLFNIGGPISTGGAALDWLLGTLLCSSLDYDAALALAAQAPPGADGLLFFPYLAGEELTLGSEVRGMFFGLSLAHSARHLIRAVLEGVALAGRCILEALLQAGGVVDEVITYGGQARSDLWNQIKADVWNRPLCIPKVRHVGCLGAAAIAAVGVGQYPTLSVASQHMAQAGRRYVPAHEQVAVYNRMYGTFRQLYRRTHDLFADVARPREA
jgi:sugar (pentulose or hexulose) kinase